MTDAEEAADLVRRHQDASHTVTLRAPEWAKPAKAVEIDLASVVKLLIKKGCISEIEALRAACEGMEDEVERSDERRREIEARFGRS